MLKCHTVQQVIAGSILGLLFGFIGYKLYFIIFDFLQNYINNNSLNKN